ncbi:MAG: hypothetical protein LBT03_01565 [Holosporales bacterium]|nr:hypothetical protein [Holosporales bacterium]
MSNFCSFANSEKLAISHLPLSRGLSKTFPNVKATCFVIVNANTWLVVHEKNSMKKIHKGTFSYSDREQLTLCEMCSAFADSVENNEINFFRSEMSGVGGACMYINKHSCKFFIVLYGLSFEDEVAKDIAAICKWCDRFVVTKASGKSKCVAEIPVFYGTKHRFQIISNEKADYILLWKDQTKQIRKVYRYRTALAAPVQKNMEIGTIDYITDTFQNPITKPIVACIDIPRAGVWQNIKDSITYLIFGSS